MDRIFPLGGCEEDRTMSDPEPIKLEDEELWQLLENINGARFAGQWSSDSPVVEAVSKMLGEARRHGYDVGCLREIACWAPVEPAAVPGL